MELVLRDTMPEEEDYINEFLSRLPEIHRKEVTTFAHGDRGYYYIVNKWMVNDNEKSMVWDEWYCPTEGRAVMCPGPCPDGTPHTKIENN